ncbi:unnamed protein product [Moneuplotes crassus]|uniref:Protein kinase domain-containing protein n=1 Tax=Euplotes crassus TaxID=5936 RepID=A0AAD1X622_EUPCR|nr:unnamed protein product [Moneuplotes crassus]
MNEMVKGGLKDKPGHGHTRTLSDSYNYNFQNNNHIYTSGPSTIDGRMTHLKSKSKEKKSQMTYDVRRGLISPKMKYKYNKKDPALHSTKGYYEQKPFEYKFTSSSLSKRGASTGSGSAGQPSVNYTSPRSKVKNIKNCNKMSKNVGLLNYGSPKRPFKIIQDKGLSNISDEFLKKSVDTRTAKTSKPSQYDFVNYEADEKSSTGINKCYSQPNLQKDSIIEKLRGNSTKLPLNYPSKKKSISEKEHDMMLSLSIKEGNQRIDRPVSQINPDVCYIEPPMGPTVQSPVIMDNCEDDQLPIHSIKSNFQYASGNKFDINSNKITLVKNLKRNGDMNEVVAEGTSSGSNFGISPRQAEILRQPSHKQEEEKIHNLSSSGGNYPDRSQLSNSINEANVSKNNEILSSQFRLNNLEGLEKARSPMLSSRPTTDRNKELEAHTNIVVSLIRRSFNNSLSPPETTTDFYKIGRVLGKGAFGKVNLAMHTLAKRLVAIKSLNKKHMQDESAKKKVLLEMSILEKLKHPNIVRLYEIFESEKHMLYVNELCVGGDLLTYVRKRRRLKESLAKYLFLQIIDGLRYMHSKGILHRDVKLDNILLDETGKVKICDFGVSRFAKPGQLMTEQCGTPAYIAPEILRGRGYTDFGIDVWSAGVVLYAMLYGSVPFKGNGIQEMHPYILAGDYKLGDEASESAKDLLRKILNVDETRRYNINQILAHEWMQNIKPKENIFNGEEMEEIDNEFNISKAKNIYNLYRMNTFNTEMHEMPFTEGNIDSTQNALIKNITTKSVVLAPFNSTLTELGLIEFAKLSDLTIPKKKTIKFKGRVKELDREYEKNNNGDLDNGVYNRNTESLLESVHDSIQDLANNQDLNEENSEEEVVNAHDISEFDQVVIDYELVDFIVQNFGYPKQYIITELEKNSNNYCTALYYLLSPTN